MNWFGNVVFGSGSYSMLGGGLCFRGVVGGRLDVVVWFGGLMGMIRSWLAHICYLLWLWLNCLQSSIEQRHFLSAYCKWSVGSLM